MPSLDSLLSSRDTPLWKKIKDFIDSLPDNEVIEARQVAEAIGSTVRSIGVSLPSFNKEEVEKRVIVLTSSTANISASRKRFFANEKTIKNLKQAIGKKYEDNNKCYKTRRKHS